MANYDWKLPLKIEHEFGKLLVDQKVKGFLVDQPRIHKHIATLERYLFKIDKAVRPRLPLKVTPKIGKKAGEYLTVEEVEAFVLKNKTWYTYGKDGKASDFDLTKTIESIAKKLHKNNVVLVDFHNKLAIEYANLAVKAIGK